ncbi:MAG TPA: hypothetical protein PLQ65_11270, partial [Flavihumibacter sp.]|nr:hypothetical protein [Flavihumibacter sp.]
MNKRLLKVLLIFTLLLSIKTGTQAQTTDLPKVIKPSPEVSTLFKFQDYPMDYSTGLPQITIPLYQVKSGSLGLSLSLSYHASGRKVYDQDGAIAANWSLSSGGMISRTAKGSVDFGTPTQGTFTFPNPFKLDNLTNYDDLNYLQKIIHLDNYDCNTLPWSDSEFDIFSYSFAGKSGKFFFKDNAGVKTPVLLPYKPYKITPYYTNTGITSFEIIDDEGIFYQFTPTDSYNHASNATITGWSLTKIVSANKADTISISYTGASEKRTTISQSTVLIDDWSIQGEAYPLNYLTDYETTNEENYQTPRLSQITFKQGKLMVEFVAGTSKIDNIKVLDNANSLFRQIQFSRSQLYSQSELQQAVNKLDGILFKDKNNNTVETYSFEYYPVITSNGQLNPRYCDWWGYYNNSGQHDYVPRWTGLNYNAPGGNQSISVGNPASNRNPSLEPVKSGVLKKITYPTGGSTELIYELNKCTLNGSAGTPINGPGLRLYQQKTEDQNGNIHFKTFKYGVDENGYGAIDLLPEMSYMTTEL